VEVGITYLLTSLGSFLSFQTARSNAPPSRGKSVFKTPFRVATDPGERDILRM
jgi:hypothetical protein